MDEELLRRVVARREQQRGPVDAVEAQDVLREQVADVRPEDVEVLPGPRVRQRAEVVDERVGPDVGDLIRIPRDRDAPRLARAADREVAEAARDEAARLVVTELRQHEVGPLVVELQQLVLVGGEAEEPVLLLDPFRHGAVDRALAVHELGLGLERLAAVAVEARRRRPGRRRRCRRSAAGSPGRTACALIARPDEEVDRRVQATRQLLPGDDDLVGVLLRLEPLLRRDARHLVRVLVDPREEERLLPRCR